MKKIFTLFAASAVALCANAETATFGSAQGSGIEKDNEIACGVLTIPGNYFASGSSKVDVYNGDKGLKVRANKGADSNELMLTVNEGYTVTALQMGMVVNDASSTFTLTGISIDGTAIADFTSIALPNTSDASGNAVVDLKDIKATESIAFYYDFATYEGKNKQVFIAGDVTYTDGAAEEPTENVVASWDFTKWSEVTIANLKAAGSNWSDDEKDNGTTVDGKCFWQVSASADLSSEKYVEANGVVIAELKGLVYTNTKDRSLAIAVDYPSTSLGEYHGAQYLWLGGKGLNYFIIPGVPAGATIKMGIESHKTTDARGVDLTINGEKLTAPDGSEVAVPTTYEDLEWIVPTTAAESNDVQITNTNGCHIYYITVTAAEGTTGVENAAIDENAPVEYYNLQGVRVAEPTNGLYIKRQGNKAVKVIVK